MSSSIVLPVRLLIFFTLPSNVVYSWLISRDRTYDRRFFSLLKPSSPTLIAVAAGLDLEDRGVCTTSQSHQTGSKKKKRCCGFLRRWELRKLVRARFCTISSCKSRCVVCFRLSNPPFGCATHRCWERWLRSLAVVVGPRLIKTIAATEWGFRSREPPDLPLATYLRIRGRTKKKTANRFLRFFYCLSLLPRRERVAQTFRGGLLRAHMYVARTAHRKQVFMMSRTLFSSPTSDIRIFCRSRLSPSYCFSRPVMGRHGKSVPSLDSY